MKLLVVALPMHLVNILHPFIRHIGIFILCFIFFMPFMAQASICSSGWKITGYYSPVESDFSKVIDTSVLVKGLGRRHFNQHFVADVKMNGWGRTRFGWYLGYFGNQWHKSATPLDAQGKHLQLGAVAIDKNLLKMGNKITIPQVNDLLGVAQFVARDTGSAIKNKHIDVYTGEGKLARKVSWQVTGKQQVCIASI